MNKVSLSGNRLKLIAITTMLVDHIGEGLLSHMLGDGSGLFAYLYLFCRIIGRTAFPLFAFLLVEGFIHTKSRVRYFGSILLTAIISEYPYRLLFGVSGRHCNVMFTLAVGILMLIICECSERTVGTYVRWGLALAGAFLACFFLGSEYYSRGIPLIFIFYVLRNKTTLKQILGYIVMVFGRLGFCSLPAFYFVGLYNGERGKDLGKFKYIFYVFYTVHIMLLYQVKVFLLKL